MFIWQLLIFGILTLMGFYYLFVGRYYKIKWPMKKRRWFLVDNSQMLFLFMMATAILSCGSTLMANRLLLCIILCCLALWMVKRPVTLSITVWLYAAYLLWLVIEIFYSPVKNYGFRVFLKYLYPFVIMLFASKIKVSVPFYQKTIQIILIVAIYGLCYFLILGRIPILGRLLGSITFWGPAILDFFPVAVTIALLYYSYSKQWKYLILVFALALPSILFTNRTGLLALSITIVIFSIVRYQLKSLPYVVLGVGLLVGTVLYNDAFREKMFVKQMSKEAVIENADQMTKKDIMDNGRYAMWEWSLGHYFVGKELKGSGLGVLQHAFYTLNHPFGRLKVVHNDYVQILCDTGIIGLVLYALTLLSLIIHSLILYFRSKKAPILRMAAIISGVSMAGMLSTLYTDNVVNYSMMTLSFPFALYGLTLSLNRKYHANL